MKKIPTKEELDNSIQQEMAEISTRQGRVDRAILRLQALRKRLSVLMGLRDLLVAYEAETLPMPAKRPAKKALAAAEKAEETAGETAGEKVVGDSPSDAVKAAFETYRATAKALGHRLGRFVFVSPKQGWKARCLCGARPHVDQLGNFGLGDALLINCSYEWPEAATPEPGIEKPVRARDKPEPIIEEQVKVKGKPGPKPKPKLKKTPVLDTGDETHGGLLRPGATAYGNFVTMLKGLKALTESNGHRLAAFEQDPKGYTARCLHCRKVVRLSRIGTQSGLALKEMCT
jgi:hypothetical protein